jgi:hypothetical protein
MDANRFDHLAHRLGATPTRRITLGGLAALTALVMAMGRAEVLARKKHKKKRKKKPPLPPTCLESCHAPCTACFTRKEGSLLCGSIEGVTLASCGGPCFTDNDCVGTGFPYCALSLEERATGDVTEFSICDDVPGRCTDIPACGS